MKGLVRILVRIIFRQTAKFPAPETGKLLYILCKSRFRVVDEHCCSLQISSLLQGLLRKTAAEEVTPFQVASAFLPASSTALPCARICRIPAAVASVFSTDSRRNVPNLNRPRQFITLLIYSVYVPADDQSRREFFLRLRSFNDRHYLRQIFLSF